MLLSIYAVNEMFTHCLSKIKKILWFVSLYKLVSVYCLAHETKPKEKHNLFNYITKIIFKV